MIFWQDIGMTCGKGVKLIFPYGHWLNPSRENIFSPPSDVKTFHLSCTLKFKAPVYGFKWALRGQGHCHRVDESAIG